MWTRRRPIAAIVFALVVACGGGSECKVETIHYTKSLNGVSSSGETQGMTVARFDLTQDFVSHTPYAACASGPLQDVGNVSLSITNLVPKPILLRYDVQGLSADGLPKWSHPDTLGVRLEANQTISVGQIVTTPIQLGVGGARVLLQTAQYVP